MAPLLKHNSELLFITRERRLLSTESNDLRRETPLGVIQWQRTRRLQKSPESTSGPANAPRVPRYFGNQSNLS